MVTGRQFAGYEIVKYQPEYRGQLLKLQSSEWGADFGKNSAYLDWKFNNNPYYVAGPIIYLALHEGQAVGTRAWFGTRWQGGQPNEVMSGLSNADAVVHPEHRRRGLLQAMTSMALGELSQNSDYAYDMTLSATVASAAHILNCGWRSVGSLQWAFRQAPQGGASRYRKLARRLPILPDMYRRVRDHVRQRGAISAPSLTSAFDALDRAATHQRRDTTHHVWVGKAPRSRAMAELAERVETDGRIRHLRDELFFAWRFQNPLSEYRFLFSGRDRLGGYLVLQTPILPRGAGWVTIVDWEATSVQVWADLLQVAIQWGAFAMLTVWTATLSDDAKGVLWENGFRLFEDNESEVPVGYWPTLFVRPIAHERQEGVWMFSDRNLLDMSEWDLRPIDSDSF